MVLAGLEGTRWHWKTTGILRPSTSLRTQNDDVGLTAPCLCGGVVTARPRLDVLDVDLFELEVRSVVAKAGFGGFEELFVVALGEVRLVVGATGLVAEACTLHDDAGKL